ncbi:MAG: beta-ketoacyl-ACP synthase II [Bacteroidia bacterium]|nr:beta-ketoacyl-ACP synthase II [Bacteroidia bacterium]MDW8302962.1 beta-ketoacyl-ACP synthase II [Bacteroidia bacterium]
MQLKRVVVTGMGALTPIGLDIPTYWEGLKSGTSGANLITKFDTTKFKTKFACELKNFDPLQYLDRKEAQRMDSFCHYAIAAAEQAMQDSGLNLEKINLDRAGVVVGSGIGGIHTFFQEVQAFVKGDGTPRFNPFFIPKMIIDLAPGHISIRYGFRGPNYSAVSACATSSHNIIDAFNLIRLGKADVIITGGSEAAVTPTGIGGFNAMKALSERNDDYLRASRPYDKERDGFVLGEGAGILILEELEHALNRGAKIYAEIAGCGMSADAYHITAPDPEGKGVRLVMRNALEDAGMSVEDIDYINTHGTSTPLGDVAEAKAIVEVFGEHAKRLSISSTKSMTGHLLGAAGAVELIACILAIQHNLIPPTINHEHKDEECPDLDYTFNVAKPRNVRAALSNTFGFGGHNTSIIVKRYE